MTIETRVVGDPLQTERLEDGRRRLLRNLVVKVDGLTITVPVDNVTDFSSIPWFGRALVRWSRVDIAGVVHDWLYETGPVSRARADKIWFLVAIAGEHHANLFQAGLGWLGLRIGGWIGWNRYRRRDSAAKARVRVA